MLHGNWKNFDELEESLSLNELNALLDAIHEKEHKANKFAASLKGIDLDKEVDEMKSIDELALEEKNEAEAWAKAGIGFIEE